MSNRTLIIVAHPNLAQSRVNRAWIEELRKAGGPLTIHELAAAVTPAGKFNIAAEQKLLEAHDRIFIQFPLFWFNVPALLKQWLDEVFAYGWAFGPGGDKLKGKEIGLAVSTGGKAESYAAGFTIAQLTSPMELTIRYVGAKPLPTHLLHGALYELTDAELARNADAYVQHVKSAKAA
jgi:putative NADPH-quinone reductase